MGYSTAIWDLDNDLDGNTQHIAEHGITKEEVEEVLENSEGVDTSRLSSMPIAFGETSTGKIIAVVFEEIDQDSVYPITAFEVEP